jgi:DNA-3-methyladenine glycosylase II
VRRQVARVLSLDHDGVAWLEAGARDPVLGAVQARHPGLRPVLFPSPYEAALWAVLSEDRPRAEALDARRRLGEALGVRYLLAGRELVAMPLPERLREVGHAPGLDPDRAARLRVLAGAALEGRLDPQRLQAMEPETALRELRELPGIGPFAAGLVVIRASGLADVPVPEPRALERAVRLHGLTEAPEPAWFAQLLERWRPFRTWALVLLRVDAERAGAAPG